MWHSALANHRWQITAQLLLRIKVTRNSLLSLTTNVMCYLVPLVMTRDQRRCWRREIWLMNVQRNSILQFVWFSSSCSLLTILFGMATESPSEHEEIRVLDQETPRSSAAESGDRDPCEKATSWSFRNAQGKSAAQNWSCQFKDHSNTEETLWVIQRQRSLSVR